MRWTVLFVSSIALGGCSEDPPLEMTTAIDLDASGRVPDLVCPGAVGCEEATAAFVFGVAKRDITPVLETWTDLDQDGNYDEGEPFVDQDGDGRFDPVWLAGFSLGRPATGVHDPIWARVLTLRKGDLQVAIVALDLVGFFHDDVIAVRQAVRARNLGVDHVLVASTHQHEGPDTMGLWGASLASTGRNPAYVDLVVKQIADAVEEAVRSEAPGTITVARGEASSFVADSREPLVIDAGVTAVEMKGSTGDVRAHLVVWGNHPEALAADNTLITSDYPHYLRGQLESAHPGSTTVFLAGSLGGLMNPLRVTGCPKMDGTAGCDNGSFEKARYIGEGAADAALAALGAAGAVVDEDPAMALRRSSAVLPVANLAFAGAFQLGLLSRTVFSPSGRPLSARELENLDLATAVEGGLLLQTEVDVIQLGPIQFLGMPGEIYPELWLEGPDGNSLAERPAGADYPDAEILPPLSSLLPPSPFRTIINQANDSLGYVIPKTQFDVERPRAYREDGQYGEQNSVGPDTAPLLFELTQRVTQLELR